MTRRKNRGFSLIELLLASVVLAMLVGLGTLSFSMFSGKWSDLESAYMDRAADLRRVVLLRDSVNAAVPWKVSSDRGSGYYFLGDAAGFTLVTERPIFSRGNSAVIRVLAERESNGQTWRLAYEEASLEGVLLDSADRQLPFNRRIVVLSGIRDLSFQFLGWRLAEQRFQPTELGTRPDPQWMPRFDGIESRQQPVAVRINMDGDYTVLRLPDRAEEWESGEVLE